jgi:hypothetical protein
MVCTHGLTPLNLMLHYAMRNPGADHDRKIRPSLKFSVRKELLGRSAAALGDGAEQPDAAIGPEPSGRTLGHAYDLRNLSEAEAREVPQLDYLGRGRVLPGQGRQRLIQSQQIVGRVLDGDIPVLE